MFDSMFTDANMTGSSDRVYCGWPARISGLIASKLKLVSLGFYCGYAPLALHVEACHLHVQYKRTCLHIKRAIVQYLCEAGVDWRSIFSVAHRPSLPVIEPKAKCSSERQGEINLVSLFLRSRRRASFSLEVLNVL